MGAIREYHSNHSDMSVTESRAEAGGGQAAGRCHRQLSALHDISTDSKFRIMATILLGREAARLKGPGVRRDPTAMLVPIGRGGAGPGGGSR